MGHDTLDREIADVQAWAARIIREVMQEGRGKHPPYTWAKEDWREHALKGCRHAQTAMLEEHGWAPQSGEQHLRLAVTRMCMAAVVRETERVAPGPSSGLNCQAEL